MNLRLLLFILPLIPSLVFGQVSGQVKKKPRPFLEGYTLYSDNRKREVGYVQELESKRRLDKFNFRRSTSGVIREIRAVEDHVVGFGFQNGAKYIAINYTHEDNPGRFFVKVLEEGNMSLFSDNDTLILRIQSGSTFELTATNFRSVLGEATVDCPEASKVAEYLRFAQDVLIDFVKGYNKCLKKEDPTEYDPFGGKKYPYFLGIRKDHFFPGLLLGVEFSQLELEATATMPTISLIDHSRVSAGFLFYIEMAKSNFLEMGIQYKPREFVGIAGSSTNVYQVNIKYDEVTIPFTFRHSFLQKNSTTFQGSVGVAVPILLNQSSWMSTEMNNNGVVTTTVSQPYTGLSRTIQFSVGLGVVVKVNSDQRLLVHNTLSFAPGSINTTTENIGNMLTAYSLTFGFAF